MDEIWMDREVLGEKQVEHSGDGIGSVSIGCCNWLAI